MVDSTQQAPAELCTACFDGHYPLGLPAGNPNAELVAKMPGSTVGTPESPRTADEGK